MVRGILERAFRRAVLAALVAVGLVLALAPRADAYVYWNNELIAMGRAGLDGSGANLGFIAGVGAPVGAVAVDGAHVYWVGPGPRGFGGIGRANLDGSGVDQGFIAAPAPNGIAVDRAHIYWANRDNTIGRANLDGSGVDQTFIADLFGSVVDQSLISGPQGLAVDGRHIYWANDTTNTIGRANLDGSGVDQRFITGARFPRGVAVDRRHVYWANVKGRTIGRAKLDGSRVDQRFIAGVRGPQGLAVDGRHVYWVNGTSRTIGRAKLDGSRVDQRFIAGAQAGWWVAVDALPSNAVSLGRKQVLADGSARLELRVPGAGAVSAEEAVTASGKKRHSALIKRVRTRANAAGTATLTLAPTTRAQRLLRRGRKVRIEVKVTFTPSGGIAASKTTRITLRKGRTWVPPRRSSQGCKVTNSGRITAAGRDTATFGGTAQVKRGPRGEETYEDNGPATPLKVRSSEILAVRCNRSGTGASVFGTANVSGQGPVDLRIDVTDRGETGTNDTYRIRLTNGYDSGTQKLEQGNVQIHTRD